MVGWTEGVTSMMSSLCDSPRERESERGGGSERERESAVKGGDEGGERVRE